MTNQELIIWQGGLPATLLSSPVSITVTQSRFFTPQEIIVSRYGVAAMLIVDNRPEKRNISYDDVEWTGLELKKQEVELPTDPTLRAHFCNTEQGFSIIRAFVIPSSVIQIFERDRFLGEPMISKCCCDKTFNVEFDEVRCLTQISPTNLALPLIEEMARGAWKEAGIPDKEFAEWRQVRTWLSFHGWFAYSSAIEQAQRSLEAALCNFDGFIQRFDDSTKRYTRLLSNDTKTLSHPNSD